MYTAQPPAYNPINMTQMGMMGAGSMPMPMMVPMVPAVRTTNPNFFMFAGPALTLKQRMDVTTYEQLQCINDCHFNILGTQIQTISICSITCTYLMGGFCIFPLLFTCMNWWKKCTFAANTLQISSYRELQKLFKAPSIKNITLTVNDNTFNKEKAGLLHAFISESNLKGFTFVNTAGSYDFNDSQYSDFIENMRPIKYITRVMSDMRWGEKIVSP